jgi:hypothetical protein
LRYNGWREKVKVKGKESSEERKMQHTSVHLVAGTCSVAAVRKADKGKALGSLGLSVPGEEDSGDTTETLEQIPELLLLC